MIRLLLALALTTALAASAAVEYRIPQTSEAWKKWKAAGYVTTIEEIVAATKPTDNPAVEEFIHSYANANDDFPLFVGARTIASKTLQAYSVGQLSMLMPVIRQIDSLPKQGNYVFRFGWNNPVDSLMPQLSAFYLATKINCARLKYFENKLASGQADKDEQHDLYAQYHFIDPSNIDQLLLDNLRWARWLGGNPQDLSILSSARICNETTLYISVLLSKLSDDTLQEIVSESSSIIAELRTSFLHAKEYGAISYMLTIPNFLINKIPQNGHDSARKVIAVSLLASCEAPFDQWLTLISNQIEADKKTYYEFGSKWEVFYPPEESDHDSFGQKIFLMFSPSYPRFRMLLSRNADLLNRTRILCALELYRRTCGAWPDKLDSLIPKFLPELPISELTGKPFEYRHGKIEYSERQFDFRDGRIIEVETVTKTADGVMLPTPKLDKDYGGTDLVALTPLP